MSREEKSTRMRLLRSIVEQHNVHRWSESFLDAAAMLVPKTVGANGGATSSQLVKPELARQEVQGVAPIAVARTRSRGKSASL